MPSLLDYYGDDEAPKSDLSFQGLKKYWVKLKEEESGQYYQWNGKDQTLLSRLTKEYPSDKIVEMMDYALKHHPTFTLGAFFKERENIYQTLYKPKNYGYD